MRHDVGSAQSLKVLKGGREPNSDYRAQSLNRQKSVGQKSREI
jgi:hypothetical protein